jgi:hypothetical protein
MSSYAFASPGSGWYAIASAAKFTMKRRSER